MKKRSYAGYKGFDYLEKTDYKQFEWPKGIGWGNAEPYELPLSQEEEERVNKIVENNIVISLHDHLASIPKDVSSMAAWIEATRENRAPIDWACTS